MPLLAVSSTDGSTLPAAPFDVRGWTVRTRADGEKAGTVHDLLITEDGTPRYLDIDLGLMRKHVLLPVGQARADRENRTVWLPGLTRAQFRDIPAYRHDLTEVTREYEAGLVSAYDGGRRPRPSYAGAVYGPSELEDRTRPRPRLAALSDLPDHRIPPDEPEPRGWRVLTADGRELGRVADLLVDTGAGKVRYFVCAVDEEALGLDRQGRRVLVPVGYARLDEGNRNVLVDVVTSDEISRMPVLSGDEVHAQLERETLDAFRGKAGSEGFYRDARFDPSRFYGPEIP